MVSSIVQPCHDRPVRERILLTAHDLFYRQGIRATGIDKIIAASGITKVTFYRYFPSKDDLICAFLEYRHERWLGWFKDALQRHGAYEHAGLLALVPVLREWFNSSLYRGCAFINTVAEFGDVLPGAVEISKRHKRDMQQTIAALLPATAAGYAAAAAAALAVDGAIVKAQLEKYGEGASESLQDLQTVLLALIRSLKKP